MKFAAICVCLVIMGCGSERRPAPGTRADVGPVADTGNQSPDDAGIADATIIDVGAQDAATIDGGLSDAQASDSGFLDASAADATAIDAGGGPISVQTNLTFSDGTVRNLSGCYFCDFTLDNGAGQSLVRFQMGAGYTIWSLTLPAGIGVGSVTLPEDFSGAHISLSESDSSVPSAIRGSYMPPGQTGTLTLSVADIREGGRIVGEVDAVLQKLGSPGVSVRLRATFSAEL